MNPTPTINKALTAAIFAAVAALGAAMLDGDLTAAEAIVSAGMGLTAGAATYRVPYFRADDEPVVEESGRHRG